MAIVHGTRHFATDEHGTPLGVTDSALAFATVSDDEVRARLAHGGARFADGDQLVAELKEAHKRIAALEGAQGLARAAQTTAQPSQRPATPAVDDALYAQHAASCAIFPAPSLNGWT